MLQPGARVSRDIVLIRRIGAGSMGEVWAAQHEGLGHEVAVKFILDEALHGVPDASKRFMREAVNATRIKSPYVVETFEFGLTYEGSPFIAMETLNGESVEDKLQRAGAMSPYEVAVMLDQVGAALDVGHHLGIVHRDIKPQNLFLHTEMFGSSPGTLPPITKVLDFGNAKSLIAPVVSNLSSPGMLAGSPAYVSRDLLLDPSDLDHRADLWALGVTAYKCLTGELPFQGEMLVETVHAIIDCEMTPPSDLRGDLGLGADAWFRHVFDEAAHLRPGSGAEMARSFKEAFGVITPPLAVEAKPEPKDSLTPGALVPLPRRSMLGGSRKLRPLLVMGAALAASGIALAAYAQ